MSYAFALVLLLTVAINTGMGIIIPVLPSLLQEYGFSTMGLSLPFIVLIIGRIVSKGASGRIINWLGDRYVLVGSFAVYTGVFLLYPKLGSPVSFVSIRFLEGIVEGIAVVSLTDMAVSLSDKARGKLMGLFSSAFGLGFILGPIIGAFAYDHFGSLEMFLSGALIGASGIVGALLLPSGSTSPKQIPRQEERLVHRIVEYTKFFPFYSPNIIRRCLFFSLMILLPLYGTEVLGLSVTTVGMLFSGSAVITTTLMPFTGRLADKMSSRNLVLWSLLAMGCLITGFGMTSSPTVFVALFLAETLAFAIMLPAGMKYFGDLVQDHPRRANIFGVFGSATEGTTLVLAVAVPATYSFSPLVAWSFLGSLCLIGALPFSRRMALQAEVPAAGNVPGPVACSAEGD